MQTQALRCTGQTEGGTAGLPSVCCLPIGRAFRPEIWPAASARPGRDKSTPLRCCAHAFLFRLEALPPGSLKVRAEPRAALLPLSKPFLFTFPPQPLLRCTCNREVFSPCTQPLLQCTHSNGKVLDKPFNFSTLSLLRYRPIEKFFFTSLFTRHTSLSRIFLFTISSLPTQGKQTG